MAEDNATSEDEALARAVHAVYGVAPPDFVATRTEWVGRLRSEGLREVAKQVGALRKPSVSAAAVNALVRADDPVVARLRDVGAKMRHAQSALDAPSLAALRDDRDEVLAAWVAAAREHTDATLTAAVEAEVRDTAVAALADPEASDVATSGSLTRALSYSGFGEVDVDDAVARTSTGVVLTRIEGGRSSDEKPAEADAEEDEQDEEEAVDQEQDEQDEEADAETDGDDVSALEMQLDEAEKVVAAARAARRTAVTEHGAAEARLASASEQLEQAQELLVRAQGAVADAEEEQSRTASALEEADEELRLSRRRRDEARAALEEAEDV